MKLRGKQPFLLLMPKLTRRTLRLSTVVYGSRVKAAEVELCEVLTELRQKRDKASTASSGANIHDNQQVTVLHVQHLHLDRESLALLLRPQAQP